jgi:hypothetical protein
MTRLILRSLLPVTSCIVDSAATYIMVVKFRNTGWPPPPQLSLYRRTALSSNSNGTRSVYNRENPKSSLYCEISMVQLCLSVHLKFYSRGYVLHGVTVNIIEILCTKAWPGPCQACIEAFIKNPSLAVIAHSDQSWNKRSSIFLCSYH